MLKRWRIHWKFNNEKHSTIIYALTRLGAIAVFKSNINILAAKDNKDSLDVEIIFVEDEGTELIDEQGL